MACDVIEQFSLMQWPVRTNWGIGNPLRRQRLANQTYYFDRINPTVSEAARDGGWATVLADADAAGGEAMETSEADCANASINNALTNKIARKFFMINVLWPLKQWRDALHRVSSI